MSRARCGARRSDARHGGSLPHHGHVVERVAEELHEEEVRRPARQGMAPTGAFRDGAGHSFTLRAPRSLAGSVREVASGKLLYLALDSWRPFPTIERGTKSSKDALVALTL